jgi:DNA-binding transcriptional LysR family regulator
MDRLQAMEVFTRVVETNSFSKAAELLDLPRGSVSNLIQALEEHVGVRLLNRTTRQVSVTEDGALYYERCVGILSEISDAESSLSNKRQSPAGTIRVDTSGTLAKALLLPALGDFYRQYPEIDVRLGLADRNIDLIQDGVDCAYHYLRVAGLSRRAWHTDHAGRTPGASRRQLRLCAQRQGLSVRIRSEWRGGQGNARRRTGGERRHRLHYRRRARLRHYPAVAFHGGGDDRARGAAGNTDRVQDSFDAAFAGLSASAHELASACVYGVVHRAH